MTSKAGVAHSRRAEEEEPGGHHPGTPTRSPRPAARPRTAPWSGPCRRPGGGRNAAIWACTGASSASRSSIRRRAAATACAPAGDKPMSSPRSSTARACGSEEPPGQAGHALIERVASMRFAHAVCSSRRSRYSCSSTRSSHTCSRRDPPGLRHPALGHQHPADGGHRPCRSSPATWGPADLAVSASSASSALIPARCSSSTTNRHPVQPSTANVTPPWPANRPSHDRNSARHAGIWFSGPAAPARTRCPGSRR